ncbi:MAG: hypothetical protein DYG93_05635 [Leptolyngbya sp. PLA2]|nr:hypothetical protein [Leptolyngbya sp.]MCE7971130.1 hypothetical protein [Leptolyngbya sp. PL-A2]MCQ3940809.1 hypothetical protein [cyanobacterium CYA1]MCZ7634172.1 hypothetical protein [Phycisphaerales bacterium]MDL1905124.1 hypothetical protein [Synechococcales cyanobacterium CNB]GIK19329.1 MAG: hypothetical protein BroJett004_14930 [Planctomycetota bacterium]
MTTLSAEAYQRQLDAIAAEPRMRDENVRLAGTGAAAISRSLLFVGAAGLALTVIGAFVYGLRHALASYLVGAAAVLAPCLGALLFTMVLHLVNAGWATSVRRQVENLMSMLPLAVGLMIPVLLIETLTSGTLYAWMDPDLRAHSYLLEKKAPYLNVTFFLIRALFYIFVWTYLARRLWWYSTEQDRTGDRWLTARARWTSAWGIPVTALTLAFAAFDWLMSLDYEFFSTMWGVYYFAGAFMSCFAIVVLTLFSARFVGRLNGLVTEDHFHDVGKLLFGFTVFWAYIAFSQYFLIWYSNIPEETRFFLDRKTGGWENLSFILAAGHFIVPFIYLMARRIKRTPVLLSLGACWLLLMHVLDMVWVVRPTVYVHPMNEAWLEAIRAGAGAEAAQAARDAQAGPGPSAWWLDVAATVGVIAVFAGFYVRKVASGPLLPLKDPRLPEAMEHKNYV